MNLLMCCTPIGREEKYLEELRFVVIAAIFFKKIYPEGRIFVGTTLEAKVPDYLFNLITFVRFPFEKAPMAFARQIFYKDFINSQHLTDDTLITGCDVIFCKEVGGLTNLCEMALTYRYHRTMPYCSDFILVKKDYKELASRFQENVIATMNWMPKEIQHGWADQLSMAIEIGFLNDSEYNGEIQNSPKIKNTLLLPGDEYLYTPNDFFSSEKNELYGVMRNDILDLDSLFSLASIKTGIHFKGNRKHLFFIFAYLCKRNNFIDFEQYKLKMTDKFLFKEFFTQVSE